MQKQNVEADMHVCAIKIVVIVIGIQILYNIVTKFLWEYCNTNGKIIK